MLTTKFQVPEQSGYKDWLVGWLFSVKRPFVIVFQSVYMVIKK